MNLGNYSLVVNDETINIIAATGDELTGRPDGNPRTKTPKGIYTEAAVARNRYAIADLFPETLPQSVKQKAAALERPTWVFLIYVTDDEIRGELSLPASFSEGEVTYWSERIIFPTTTPGDRIKIDLPGDDGPDFDVKVSRKA
jgi:hypothetical protein